jgi:hypothetical protein
MMTTDHQAEQVASLLELMRQAPYREGDEAREARRLQSELRRKSLAAIQTDTSFRRGKSFEADPEFGPILAALIDWDPVPFVLQPGVRVTDGVAWRAMLLRDVADGQGVQRDLHGAVREDLRDWLKREEKDDGT